MRTPASTKWRYRKAPYDKKREEESGWNALAAAIVKQAVDDYKFADAYLKGENQVKAESYSQRLEHRAEHTKDEVVKFFKSQWYATLCDIDPDLILRKLGVRV